MCDTPAARATPLSRTIVPQLGYFRLPLRLILCHRQLGREKREGDTAADVPPALPALHLEAVRDRGSSRYLVNYSTWDFEYSRAQQGRLCVQSLLRENRLGHSRLRNRNAHDQLLV